MFKFDQWADWLRDQAEALSANDLSATYGDSRSDPGCASNPGCGINVESRERLGSFRFWEGGTCDYEVFDNAINDFVANETMLIANDMTITDLFAQFMALIKQRGQ